MVTASPADFRAAAALRYAIGLIGALCALAAVYYLSLVSAHREPFRLLGVGVLLIPPLLAITIWRMIIRLDDSGLISRTILARRRVAYSGIRFVDERRSSVVIETAAGPVSTAWLSPTDRSRLLRALIERARLTRSMEDPPYG